MKKNIFVFCMCMVINFTFSQTSTVDTGRINNVGYIILFPEKWNNKLIMFAHGYEFMGALPRQSKNPDFNNRMVPFLERGYAIAASDYGLQGFSMPQGVEDNEALRRYFIKKYSKPSSVVMVGQSLGGGIALATIENFSKYYSGALALCPFSSRPFLQCRKEFDMYAVVNVLFPNVVPMLSNVMDINVPYVAINPRLIGVKIQKITQALTQDTLVANKIAAKFDLKAADLPMALLFNENVLRDIVQKVGGNPFDNTNTIYSGFGNDFELNKKVERLPATVEEDNIFGKYDRTGKIDKPVVIMHTVYDQLIPPQYGVINFDNMVHQQNKDKYLTVKYTNGQAHCAFTPEQTGKAFDELINWLNTGVKSKAGAIE